MEVFEILLDLKWWRGFQGLDDVFGVQGIDNLLRPGVDWMRGIRRRWRLVECFKGVSNEAAESDDLRCHDLPGLMGALGYDCDPSRDRDSDDDGLIAALLPVNRPDFVNGQGDLFGQSHLRQRDSHGFNVERLIGRLVVEIGHVAEPFQPCSGRQTDQVWGQR